MCSFRLSRFGVKTPDSASNHDAVVQTSLRCVGIAVYITQAIFLQSCFTGGNTVNGVVELRDLDVTDVDLLSLVIGIKHALELIATLADDAIPPLPAGDPPVGVIITNEEIRQATHAVLQDFVPPAPVPMTAGALVDGNTFLTAGVPHRGDIFRLCCRCIMVVSYVRHANVEPDASTRAIWLNLKHFNFLDDHVTADVTGELHVYSVDENFDEHAFLGIIDDAFPSAMAV